ncbi:hypothetical protein IMK15_06320, partial [Sneathia sp. DSM 16631]
SDVKDLLTDGQIKLNKDAYAHSYELDGKYTGVKDLELTAGAFVQHVHYANAELGDYAANPFELLYAQSLISSDKDFFKHNAEKLEADKKAFENAQKTLKNATEADKTAYENAVKEYNQLVTDVKASLESEVTTTKAAYDGVVEANKETAKKAYDKQVEINGYEKELADLEAKQTALRDLIIGYISLSKEEFRNTDTQTAELQKITDKINALEAKIDTANRELDNINGAGNAYGKKYAEAQYAKDNFSEEKFKSYENTTTYKKDDTTNKYKSDSTGKTPAQFYEAIAQNPYGQALALVNKYNDFDYLQKEYKEAIKGAKGVTAKLDLVNFGFKLGAKYTGVKNLTLT